MLYGEVYADEIDTCGDEGERVTVFFPNLRKNEIDGRLISDKKKKEVNDLEFFLIEKIWKKIYLFLFLRKW